MNTINPLLFFLIIWLGQLDNQTKFSGMENPQSPTKESFLYNLKVKKGFLSLEVGEARYLRKINPTGRIVELSLKTTRWKRILNADVVLGSKLDHSTLWPQTYWRHSVINSNVVDDTITYSQNSMSAKQSVKNNDNGPYDYNFSIEEGTQNFISLLETVIAAVDNQTLIDKEMPLLNNRKEATVYLKSKRDISLESQKGIATGMQVDIDISDLKKDIETIRMMFEYGNTKYPIKIILFGKRYDVEMTYANF